MPNPASDTPHLPLAIPIPASDFTLLGLAEDSNTAGNPGNPRRYVDRG